jgi:hypothetical protein
MAIEPKAPPITPEPTLPETPQTQTRIRRKQSFKLDKEQVSGYVLDRLQKDMDDREDWNTMRIERYAKLRGWLPDKNHPLGEQASNIWVPIILIASLRLKAGLENAVKSIRPLMGSKARQRRNMSKQDNIDRLLDYQFFCEIDGERTIDDMISNFVDDGTTITMQKWVKRDEVIRDVRVLPQPDPQTPLDLQIGEVMQAFFPTVIDAYPMGNEMGEAMPGENDASWRVMYKDENNIEQMATVEFYDTEDGRIEACITTKVRTYDGPAVEVCDLEDIVVPIRCANLQPTTAENPHGAPYVNRICKTTVDAIRRGVANGTYDLVTPEELERIVQGRRSYNTESDEEMKEFKESKEGRQQGYSQSDDNGERIIVEHYGRWDVDGDGLEEDVIFWVERNTKILLRARFLTEIYPGIPVRRPFSECRLFPVPNSFYGIGLPELLEPIQDMMKAVMDQNFDWGLITNIPFFFFRPSSGLKQEDMKLAPGVGYPLDRPQEDVFFPTWNRDMSWTINTLTLLQQFAERISMQSDVQFGRVPTGKASALRTMGTTAALLQQGDVRSEQILRRLFLGLAQIFQMLHRLNKRYLPTKKEFRVIGISAQGEEPYLDVSPDTVDADVDFEFKSTLLNTNKQIVAQSLMEAIGLVLSPVAIQLGLVDAEKVYAIFSDTLKARDLDPEKYFNRPPAMVTGPQYLAEEVISLILAGEKPVGRPLEPNAQEHLMKLQQFTQSEQFGMMNEQQVMVLQQWIQVVMMILQQQLQEQAILAAAAAHQGGGQGGQEGPGGSPTTMDSGAAQENPAVGEGETIEQQEINQ